jgi:hypothetical protein
MKTRATTIVATLLATGSLFAGPSMYDEPKAPLPPAEDPWEFELIPYMWMPDLSGTVGIGGLTSAVDVKFEDILDNLDMVLSGAFGARKGRFGMVADFMYLEVSPSFDTPGPVFSRGDLRLKQTMLDLRGTYRVVETSSTFLDLSLGARYMNVDLDLTFRPGLAPKTSANGDEGWWDAVGGVRGQYAFTDRWFLTYSADIGGGGSNLTWQAMAGVGYRFTDNVHLTAAYRYLDYDYSSGDFEYDLVTQGIGLGLGFRW